MKSPIILAAVLAVVALGWFFRWEAVPIHRGDGYGEMYLVNRWTGQVLIVLRGEISPAVRVGAGSQ